MFPMTRGSLCWKYSLKVEESAPLNQHPNQVEHETCLGIYVYTLYNRYKDRKQCWKTRSIRLRHAEGYDEDAL